MIMISDYIVPVKRGSHMPPMHLRHGRRYCLGYCSDMRTEAAGNIAHPSLHRRHACEVDSCLRSWLKFNFAGMPAVELCDGSSCQRRMFSFVREVSQVVPAVTSQIHRRHMRTRLYGYLFSPTIMSCSGRQSNVFRCRFKSFFFSFVHWKLPWES